MVQALYAAGAAVGGSIAAALTPSVAAIGVTPFGGAFTYATANAAAVSIGSVIGGSVAVVGGFYMAANIGAASAPDGPRRDRHAKQRITTRDEGAPSIKAYGRTARVPGHIIWEQWPIQETKHKNKSGKGAGSGGEFLTYTYKQSIAVQWCKCFGRPISRVLRIWANGEVIYDVSPDKDESSTLIGARKQTSSVGIVGGGILYTHNAIYYTTSSGPDLTEYVAGKDVDVTGFVNTAYNGTFEVIKRTLLPNGDTELKVVLEDGVSTSTHPAGTSENPGASVTIFQSQPAFSKKDFAEVEHYTGSLDQVKNDEMINWEGDANVSAYRDRAYSVFTDWRLENYGNMTPQSFEALLEVDAAEDVSSAVAQMLSTSGFDASEYDVSAVAGTAFGGLISDSRTGAIDAVSQVALVHDVMLTDQSGVIVVEPRSTLETVTIPQEKMVAHVPGRNPPRDLLHVPANSRFLPSAMTISYLDSDKDYEPGAETYRMQANNFSKQPDSREVSMVMTSAEAQEIARRTLLTTHAAGHTFSDIQLPPSMLGQIRPGTIAEFQSDGRTWTGMVQSVLSGANEVIQVVATGEQAQTLSHSTASAAPGGN